MGMILLLVLLCIGACGYTLASTSNIKRDYNKASYLSGEYERLYKDTSKLNRQYKDWLQESREDIRTLKHHNTILTDKINILTDTVDGLNQRVESLEYDNKLLKQKLNIRDSVSKHCKIIEPFRTSM